MGCITVAACEVGCVQDQSRYLASAMQLATDLTEMGRMKEAYGNGDLLEHSDTFADVCEGHILWG